LEIPQCGGDRRNRLVTGGESGAPDGEWHTEDVDVYYEDEDDVYEEAKDEEAYAQARRQRMDAFTRPELEAKRTLFLFYGYRESRTGEISTSTYFKQAHSLGEALADLHGNAGVMDVGGYVVQDACVVVDEDGSATVHVHLITAAAHSDGWRDEDGEWHTIEAHHADDEEILGQYKDGLGEENFAEMLQMSHRASPTLEQVELAYALTANWRLHGEDADFQQPPGDLVRAVEDIIGEKVWA
jgi:hypothetical protein